MCAYKERALARSKPMEKLLPSSLLLEAVAKEHMPVRERRVCAEEKMTTMVGQQIPVSPHTHTAHHRHDRHHTRARTHTERDEHLPRGAP
jgi:hypothetical protein